MHNLRSFFLPASVAIIGASNDPSRIGGRPIDYSLRAGFSGPIFPINPNRSEIQGLRSYPDLKSVPSEVELLIVSLPAEGVLPALEGTVEKGVKGAIVFSAGFAEIGRKQEEETLREYCRAANIRVLGPNCLGSYNASHGLAATFGSFLQNGLPVPGEVAIASQSGAFGSYLFSLAMRRGVRISHWASTGNEMDVTVADLINHFAQDDAVRVILCAMEGVKSGRDLLNAMEAARTSGKPLIVFKSGRTPAGAAAAESHTGSLVVDDAVFDAAVRHAGALRVQTISEMLDLAYALQARRPLHGNRLGVVTMSGGAGVVIADAAAECGLALPPLPEDDQARITRANPFGSALNPVDVTAQALNETELIVDPLKSMLVEGRYDAVVAVFMNWLSSPSSGAKIQAAIKESMRDAGRATIALVAAGDHALIQSCEQDGVLVFEDPSRAVATLGAMHSLSRAMIKRRSQRKRVSAPQIVGNQYDEVSTKALLKRAGIPTLDERFVPDPRSAGTAADQIGGRVALKIVSRDIPHKSDVGGVSLGLIGAVETCAEASQMLQLLSHLEPRPVLGGFLVSPMIDDGIELILGARNDATFGPVVMIGIGGVFVEALNDVVLRVGAVDCDEARSMVEELRGKRLLNGMRGRPPSDVDALAETIARFSEFACDNAGNYKSMEINPLVVRTQGQGCIALDALITF